VDTYIAERLLFGVELMARPDENARTMAPILENAFLVVI
jgi:hypothetical protein